MPGSRFVPDSWQLTDHLRDYAKKKGLSDNQIDDQEEAFRLCQFPREILCFDRAWQRWVRNAIEWGRVTPSVTREYKPYETPIQTQEERRKAEQNLERLSQLSLKVVK